MNATAYVAIRRIKGQVEAIDRALGENLACSATLQLIAAARGAMNGLMAEVLDEHVRSHVLGTGAATENVQAADELLDVVRAYLK